MEKNNQPIIVASIIAVAVLIIALAFIFTRSSDDDTATETSDTNNTSENQENENTEGGGENGQQPAPTPTPQPVPEPDPTPVPTPQLGVLPVDWDNLTDREKTDLNPFGCDTETQIIYADDGTCHDVPIIEEAPLEFETKAELEAYIQNPDYADEEKLYAQRIYCSYEFNEPADKCLAWGSYRHLTGNPFDGIVETERDREEKNCEDAERTEEYGGRIFCGSEEAYERWQALLAEPEVQALYEEQAVADDRFYTIADEMIARLSLNIRLKHGAVVTFAQADIIIDFVK